jgi:hypothetical protein
MQWYFLGFNKYRKYINMKKIIIILLAATITAYFVLMNSTAVIIGDDEFTHNDITNLFNIEQKIASNTETNVIKNKEDVLYNLVLTSLQKSILIESKVDLNKNQNTKIIENSNSFKNLYKETKESLGETDYYRLMIEPVIVNKLFYDFYKKLDLSKKNAEKVLDLLQKYKFESVANAINIKPISVNIPKSNKDLFKSLDNKIGVYNKIISFDDKFIISNVLGYDKEYIKTNSFVFENIPYKNFLTKVLKMDSIQFPFYSLYSLEDIVNKKGSVLK